MAEESAAEGGKAPNSDHADHKGLYHWVYVAGITLLTGVVDFAFLWPEWHLGALLVLATWLSLVAIYEFRNSGYGLDVTLPVLLFAAAFVGGFWIPIHVPETVVSGTLQPANSPTPPNACNAPTGPPFMGLYLGAIAIGVGGTPDPAAKSMVNGGTLVLLGRNVRIITGNDKVTVLQTTSCPLISVQKTDNGLFVDASIYDSLGALIATIKNNAFSAIQGEHSTVERNGDLSTLIVKDTKGTELLWVRFLNPKTVQIRGVFRCPQGSTKEIIVTDDALKARASAPIVARNICTATAPISFP